MVDIFHELDLVARRGDTRLDLRGKGLEELPEEIGALDTVTELYLSDNALKKLPWSLSLLGQLKVLSLQNNKLKWLHRKEARREARGDPRGGATA